MYMKCHRKLERHGVTCLEINCKEVMTLQTLHCPVVTARLCRQIQRSLIFYTWCRGHKFGLVSYVSLFQNKRQPTLPEHPSSPPVFSGVRVTRSLVLCVCFVDRYLSFFFWSLRCLFFFDLRIMVTPLVSPNSSQGKPNGQSRMDNPETLATLGTQDTGRRQT